MDNKLEVLEEENLNLKLEVIRKDIEVAKKDAIGQHDHTNEKIDKILVQVIKTNGSVAEVTERVATIERERNSDKIKKLEKETKFWRTLTTNKWIIIPLFALGYALTIQEFREFIGAIFRIN